MITTSYLFQALAAYGALRSPPSCSKSRLFAAPKGMQWFIKTEQFSKPYPVVKPHLEAHRAWVRELRKSGVVIASGYRVDADGTPGGGGLMIFSAKNHASAETFVQDDPLIKNECVDWQLNQWIAETGDITVE